MSRLSWDVYGTRYFHTGVHNCVLYLLRPDGTYQKGVAWSGVTGITVSPSGGEPNKVYADSIKYLDLYSIEEITGTLEAYTYPDEFSKCNGYAPFGRGGRIAQQSRHPFGLCWRTILGNDVDGEDHGYLLHFLYGVKASPSERPFKTRSNSPEAITFSWKLSTMPVEVENMKPTAYMTINSTKVDPQALEFLENIIYGNDDIEPALLSPNDISFIVGKADEEEDPYTFVFLDKMGF